jgi:hypothetical protein
MFDVGLDAVSGNGISTNTITVALGRLECQVPRRDDANTRDTEDRGELS